MSAAPVDVMSALDRLNGHARSHGCGRRAIYEYKGAAATVLAHAGELIARPVALMAKCHSCYGTGSFYWGDTGERCRTCGATGYVYLRFCETQAAGFCWHHPWGIVGESIYRAATKALRTEYQPATRSLLVADAGGEREVAFESPGEWRTNQPGEKLIGEAVAALLNVVEGWVDRLTPDNSDHLWPIECARREMRGYILDVGRIGEVCHYCGGNPYCGQRMTAKKLSWSIPTCKDHAHMPLDQWDKAIPPSAITPEVERWLLRRGWRHEEARLMEQGTPVGVERR